MTPSSLPPLHCLPRAEPIRPHMRASQLQGIPMPGPASGCASPSNGLAPPHPRTGRARQKLDPSSIMIATTMIRKGRVAVGEKIGTPAFMPCSACLSRAPVDGGGPQSSCSDSAKSPREKPARKAIGFVTLGTAVLNPGLVRSVSRF